MAQAREWWIGYATIVAAAVAAWVLAWHRARRDAPRLVQGRWVQRLLDGALFAAIAVPMALRLSITQGWWSYFNQPQRFVETIVPSIPWLLMPVVAFGVGLWAILRFDLSDGRFWLLLYLPLYALSRGVYLALVDPERWSDFHTMWSLVERVAERGRLLLPSDMPEATALQLLYLRRILPIWSPLALVFGASPWVYKLSNALLVLGACAIAYRLARRYFGRRAAQLAVWPTLFVPELLYSIAIPTHDIPGAFLLMVYLLCYDRLWVLARRRRWGWAAAAAVLTGGAMFAAELQRDYGVFAMAGAVLFGGAMAVRALAGSGSPGARVRRALVAAGWLCLAPTVVFRGLVVVGVKGGLFQPRDQNPLWTYIFCSLDNPNGNFTPGMALYTSEVAAQSRVEPPLAQAVWDRYYTHAILSEYYANHLRFVPQWVNRAERLLTLGGSSFFYLSRLTPASPVRPDSPVAQRLTLYNTLLTPVALALIVAACCNVLASPGRSWRVYPPLTLLAAMLMVMLLLTETQPRYVYPIWVIFPIYLGRALDDWFRPVALRRPSAGLPIFGLAAGFGLATSAFLGAMLLYSRSPHRMIDQRSWYVDRIDGTTGDVRRVPTPYQTNMLRLALQPDRPLRAGDRLQAYAVRTIDPGRPRMIIGLLQTSGPSQRTRTIEVSISVNGEVRWRARGDELRQSTFAVLRGVAPDAAGRLELTLEARALEDWPADAPPQEAAVLLHRCGIFDEDPR